MSMVGSRGATFGSVVEHHHLGIFVEQIEHLAIVAQYALWLVAQRGDGEVCGQNGERIDKQLKVLVDNLLGLLLGAVGLAEEARTLGYCLLVDLGTRGCYPCGIPLHVDGDGVTGQFACLHSLQLLIASAGLVPCLQLAVEESEQRTVDHDICLTLLHLLACRYFQCAQAVLIQVVGINLVDTQRRITVASPSAT